MVQHHASVAVHAGVVYEGPDVHRLAGVADARTHSDGDVVWKRCLFIPGGFWCISQTAVAGQ